MTELVSSTLLVLSPSSLLLIFSNIAVAALTATFTHMFTQRRDTLNFKRELERDERSRHFEIEKQERARQTEIEAQEEARKRKRAAISIDVLEQLSTHCSNLRPWLIQKNPSADGWKRGSESLTASVEREQVKEALGIDYPELRRAIRYEEKSIMIQEQIEMEFSTSITAEDGAFSRGIEVERHYYHYRSLQNVADVLKAYAPCIAILGDPLLSKELTELSISYLDIARHRLSLAPHEI